MHATHVGHSHVYKGITFASYRPRVLTVVKIVDQMVNGHLDRSDCRSSTLYALDQLSL